MALYGYYELNLLLPLPLWKTSCAPVQRRQGDTSFLGRPVWVYCYDNNSLSVLAGVDCINSVREYVNTGRPSGAGGLMRRHFKEQPGPLADPESPFRPLCVGHTLQKVSPSFKNSSDFASLCIIGRSKTNLPAQQLLRFLYISGNVQISADFRHCVRGICP